MVCLCVFLSSAVLVLLTGLIGIYAYFKHSWKYWERKGVPYVKPIFPFGNIRDIVRGKKQLGLVLQDFYKELRAKGSTYSGFYLFSKPIFVPIGTDIVKSVLSADFKHFHDRGLFHDEENDPVSAHLFSLSGQKWKNLRQKLTPTFSSGKLKAMFQTLLDCSNHFPTILEEPILKDEPVDIKEVSVRYTTDVISSCAFGVESNCLKNFKETNDFMIIGDKLMHPTSIRKTLQFLFMSGFPNAARFLRMRSNQEGADFFMKLANDTVTYRENNKIHRQDFMQLLIQIKADQNGVNNSITVEEIAAQCFIFFLAGFETSSSTMTFLLYEVSQNESIQNQLREEIVRVMKKHDGQLSYEAISEMTYLDRVIKETLRKYPPLAFLMRECTIDYTIPGTDITVDKGTQVFIPALALHYDPEYFPNPEVFDPDRFLQPVPEFAYIPFGEGPRICIGIRFGIMQTKVGLSKLLSRYRFGLNPKTAPLKYSPSSFVLSTVDKIWLDVSKV